MKDKRKREIIHYKKKAEKKKKHIVLRRDHVHMFRKLFCKMFTEKKLVTCYVILKITMNI